MAKRPDYHDADLVLKLYDLRREAVMRQSRQTINAKFWPKSYEEFKAIAQTYDDPLCIAFRQTSSYWEMAYGMARHGIINADYLAENSGEGLFLYAKVFPFLAEFRKDFSPTAFQNAEWMTTKCKTGKRIFAVIQARVKRMAEKMK